LPDSRTIGRMSGMIPLWVCLLSVGIALGGAWLLGAFSRRGMRLEIEEFRNENNKLRELFESARKSAADSEKRFFEQNSKINDYLAERDNWCAQYHDAASQYGTAQALLLQERAALIRQLRAAGKQPRLNPVLEAVAESCSQAHPGKGSTVGTGEESGTVVETDG